MHNACITGFYTFHELNVSLIIVIIACLAVESRSLHPETAEIKVSLEIQSDFFCKNEKSCLFTQVSIVLIRIDVLFVLHLSVV